MNDAIAKLCETAISDRIFPGCQVGYIRDGKTCTLEFGKLTYETDSPAVAPSTHYDVASITKSIPTSSLVLQMIEAGRIGLDNKAIDYLPELANNHSDAILIRHLLDYTVILDLPHGLSVVAQQQRAGLLRWLETAPLLSPPGKKYLYSNYPAILMGLIVERVGGRTLNKRAAEDLFKPLGMINTVFDTSASSPDQIAPTEVDFRGEVRGFVHDESAYEMSKTGQICGAAGLFSTANDLLIYAQMLLNEGRLNGRVYFSPETIVQMHTNQIGELGASTGRGWHLNWRLFMGNEASDETFGITGFTGGMVLVDPLRKAAVTLTTNRTYPRRPENRDAINAFRRELADIVFAP